MIADFIDELTKCETPETAWLRNAAKVIEERREQWAAEDAAAAERERKLNGSK